MRARILILFVALATLVLARSAVAQPDYPTAHWVPPACTKYYSSGNGHKFCVIHDMEGYYEWCVSYLDRCDLNTNGSYNVSASIHYMVNGLQNGTDTVGHSEYTNDMAQGDITQAVLESKYAWHALCLNTWSFGTEHEGFVSNPSWYTEEMYLSSAALQKWLCNRQSIPKDRNHIVGHNEWQNPAWTNWMYTNYPTIDPHCNNHTDPGVYWDWTHFMKLITGEPAISTQPYSQLVEAGTNATFVATVQGSNTMFLQWRKNGAAIAGATKSSFTITNAQAADAGSYTLVASNALGMITSRVATLIVSPTWVVSFSDRFETNSATRWKQFTSSSDYTATWAFDYSAQQYVMNGVTNVIPAAPSGSGTRGIKITCNKNDATGATSAVSLYPNQSFSSNYILRFDAWVNYAGGPGGTNGSTEFASCGLNHAGTRVNWTGGSASDGLYFTWDGDGATGGDDYRAYQGTGAAPSLLSFANSGMSQSGATRDHYSDPFFQSLFDSPTFETQGACGKRWIQCELAYINKNIYFQINGRLVAQRTNTTSYTSGYAMIGYMDPFSSLSAVPQDNYAIFDNVRVYVEGSVPTISAQPASQTVTAGSSATFSVTATGAAPLGFQWRFNAVNIPGATTSSYVRANAQSADAGSYSVVVTNSAGSVTSANAILTVRTPPSITTQPQSQTVIGGNSVTFSAAATGDAPLSFQWRKNGAALPGQTSTSYSIASTGANDAGTYSVVVTNAVGSVTSANATLTVNTAPSITSQPQSQTQTLGSSAVFSVTATGAAPLSYQWRFNGTSIFGANASTYTRNAVTTSDAGSYTVVVTNSLGAATSSAATLTVNISPVRLLSIVSNANQTVTMTWSVDSGASYNLQFKNSLADANWTTLATYVPAGTTLSTTDTLSNSQRVYRLNYSQLNSECAGYTQLPLLGDSDTLVSVPFTRAGVSPQTISSVSGNVVTVSGTPNWIPNQFVYSAPTQTNTYFARIISGAANGKLYAITANGVNTLTLNIGSDLLTNVISGDVLTVESYWTPATLFPNGAGVFASPTPGNRFTELLIPDTASQGINLSAIKVLYFNAGSWKQVGQGSTSHNDDILAPNSYFVVRHNVSTNSTLTTLGSVVSAKVAITLQTTSTNQQDNAVALARPVPVSLDDCGLISSGAFVASPLPGSRTDELQIFDNTVVQKNKSSSAIYYYWNGAWRRVGAGTTDVGADQVFTPGAGVVIRKATNNATATWVNSATW